MYSLVYIVQTCATTDEKNSKELHHSIVYVSYPVAWYRLFTVMKSTTFRLFACLHV